MSSTQGYLRWLMPLAVLALGLVAMTALLRSRPKAERTPPPPDVPLVEVIRVEDANGATVVVRAMGTVVPAQVLTLKPEVSGRIISHHPQLVAGGLVVRGEELLRIDDRDYKLAVQQQLGQLARAKLDLKTEHGRRLIAKKEWGALQGTMGGQEMTGGELASRVPHVQAARAGVMGARAGVDRARLLVERAQLRAPFNAYVRQEAVEVGQLVGPQSQLAILVGTDELWVESSLPVAHLVWLRWPDAAGEGASPVTVSQDVGSGPPRTWSGRVLRLLEELEPQGRMARILVRVEDPFGLSPGRAATSAGAESLLVGAYVDVVIEGLPVGQAVQIPNQALVGGDRVWVVSPEGKLEDRSVAVAWRQDDRVLVSRGLSVGERVVISPMVAPVSGMPVQTALRPE